MSLLRGDVSREEIHAWAHATLMADPAVDVDAHVATALWHLHGFDLTSHLVDGRVLVQHGAPGEYVHDVEHVRDEFEQWRSRRR